jgi:hypothetical protein
MRRTPWGPFLQAVPAVGVVPVMAYQAGGAAEWIWRCWRLSGRRRWLR